MGIIKLQKDLFFTLTGTQRVSRPFKRLISLSIYTSNLVVENTCCCVHAATSTSFSVPCRFVVVGISEYSRFGLFFGIAKMDRFGLDYRILHREVLFPYFISFIPYIELL